MSKETVHNSFLWCQRVSWQHFFSRQPWPSRKSLPICVSANPDVRDFLNGLITKNNVLSNQTEWDSWRDIPRQDLLFTKDNYLFWTWPIQLYIPLLAPTSPPKPAVILSTFPNGTLIYQATSSNHLNKYSIKVLFRANEAGPFASVLINIVSRIALMVLLY